MNGSEGNVYIFRQRKNQTRREGMKVRETFIFLDLAKNQTKPE